MRLLSGYHKQIGAEIEGNGRVLRIHFGNRIEKLADALAAELASAPPASALQPETIVVGHAGMDEWLKRALAMRLGIAANLEFERPAALVWRMLRARDPDLPHSSPLDRGPLVWRLYAALGESGQSEEAANYLRDRDELGRFELAGALATVFEQYQIYRPEWILDWELGKASSDAQWQAVLWQRVANDATPNPARLYRDFAKHAGGLTTAELPERISLFGISAMAPVFLNLFAALALTREVHLYVSNPSRAYWGDIESNKRLQRWALTNPERAEYATSGHPLLAALATQSRDFIELLNGCEGQVVVEDEYATPAGRSLLARLQTDMLDLIEEPEVHPLAGDDESVVIHVCHSRRREVEVLHDALLAAFESNPELGPEDILVMAPHMDDYADHLKAVFGAAPAARHIPWSLAERSVRAEHPLIEAMMALLALPDSRLKASEVVGLLELPAVARHYDLDNVGLDNIHRWVAEAGVRWAWDGDHRAAFELPAEPLFTWRFGLDRLLAGYALAPDDDSAWDGIAPYGRLEGRSAQALGALSGFGAQLNQWRQDLTASRPLPEWVAKMRELIGLFTPEAQNEIAAVALLQQAASDLESQVGLAGFGGEVPWQVARAAFAVRLAVPRHPRPFLSGRVTFCALAPMRSIPAKFVWLLGMSEADFPRRGRAPGFDLIAAHPRRGDRARHIEDRALFLEALLGARGAFHASYVGRSERDNAELPASVVVNLLLDTVKRMGVERERIELPHPLQPFSASYRTEPKRKASYAREWLQAPRTAVAPTPFASQLPQAPAPTEITLDELISGLANPARRYLDALGIARPLNDDASEDEEPFVLEGLRRWVVRDALLSRWLAAGAGFDPECFLDESAARGWLPPGEGGRIAFRNSVAETRTVARAVFDCVGTGAGESRDVALTLGPWTLAGRINDIFPTIGLVHARAGRLRGKDRLKLWIEHLALAASGPEIASCCHGICKGELERLRLGPAGEAAKTLQALCDLYAQSAQAALPFLPDLSLELCKPDKKGAAPDPFKALAAIRRRWREWENDEEGAFIQDADDYAFAFRGRKELFGAEFAELAAQIFQPMVAAENRS